MKIVGGKYIPGTEGEIGAYVAAIQPGSTGDGLHGELQEGNVWWIILARYIYILWNAMTGINFM